MSEEKKLPPWEYGISVASFLHQTMRLRWLTTTVAMCDGPGNDYKPRRLQQCWLGSNEEEIWKDIEEHEVSNEEFNNSERVE